jgi:hypothetical protein
MVTRVMVSVVLTVLLVVTTATCAVPQKPPEPPAYAVKVLSPNGGEIWTESTLETVLWGVTSPVAPDSIRIRLTWVVTVEGEKLVERSRLLTTIRGDNPGKWAWDKVGPVGEGMKIHVEAFFPEKIKASDVSDDYFIIAPAKVPEGEAPVVKVLSPNGGETWIAGMTETVQWELMSPAAPDSIRIVLMSKTTTDDKNAVTKGRLLTTIRGDNPGKWAWDKVDPVGEGMMIQVEAFFPEKIKVSDVSDDYFVIVAK